MGSSTPKQCSATIRYLWGDLAWQAHRRGLLLPESNPDDGSTGARQRQVTALLKSHDTRVLHVIRVCRKCLAGRNACH